MIDTPRAPDPLRFDLGHLVRRTVVSLYSSLVTRPTGRAVRIAIESRLSEQDATPALSVIDLTEVALLDFSCADEVVAKLMLRYTPEDPDAPDVALFVFHGVGHSHRGPIEAALERQALAIVATTEDGLVELMGETSDREREAWTVLEERGVIRDEEVDELSEPQRSGLPLLARRGLAYHDGERGTFHALSSLVGPPGGPETQPADRGDEDG